MTMNIALCTDEKYSFPCGVCITSILENNKEEECRIYILTDGLKPKTIEKFKRLKEKYRQKIEIINIDDQLFNGLKVCNRFPKSIYYRFLLPQILNDEKVIYLDCDIIVTANLNTLWNTDISEYACGVVEDQSGDDIIIQNRIGLYKDYFNSGVLLINLNYWRKNNIAKRVAEFIHYNPDVCVYPDQDAMNCIISDQVKFLEYKYNYQELFYQPQECILLHKKKRKNLISGKYIPTIIHYTGHFKPWVKGCVHPYKDLFIKFKEISPWNKEKIKSRYTLKWKIDTIIRQIKFCLKN